MEYTYTEEFLKDKEHENKEQYQEIATKIYDHFNLANYQIHEITESRAKLYYDFRNFCFYRHGSGRQF